VSSKTRYLFTITIGGIEFQSVLATEAQAKVVRLALNLLGLPWSELELGD